WLAKHPDPIGGLSVALVVAPEKPLTNRQFQMSDHRLYRLPSFDPAPLPSCQRLGFAAYSDESDH
ncbi:hypothetical protein, partial [Xanthomonas oryzae]|uniref:hypothetical protein n=1 Tax=Xanthomonas oryzae TaxID=347 RepID=UPI001C4AB6F9